MTSIRDEQVFLFQRQEGCDRVVVAFSELNAPDFFGFRHLAPFDCSKLFVRDPRRQWYNGNTQPLA